MARDIVTLAAASQARASGVPYVLQTHGMIVPDERHLVKTIDKLFLRRALRGASAHLALSPTEAERLVTVGVDPAKLVILGNPAPKVQPAYRSPRDGQEVLFLARLHPRKQVLRFAEMARILIQSGSNAVFVVCGPDAGDLVKLKRFMAEHQLGAQLAYAGAVPRVSVQARISGATLLVLPSDDEPFPVTVLEAMSVGVPSVVTSTCHIASELAEAGACAVSEPNAQSLSETVATLLSSVQLRQSLVAAGKTYLLDVVASEVIAARLKDVYEKCVVGPLPGPTSTGDGG